MRDVDIEIDGGAPAVSPDPEMLRVVFQNLLINSARAIQGHGRICVAVDAAWSRRITGRLPSTVRPPAAPPC